MFLSRAQLRAARRGAGHRPLRRGRSRGQGPRRHAGEEVPRRQRAGPLGRVARASARSSASCRRTCRAPRSICARSSTPRATACCTRSTRTGVPLARGLQGDEPLRPPAQFGGLGIVISIRDQMLTVMNPMPGTPAGRAGVKRFDRIIKINNESTLNMPLDDAVQAPARRARHQGHRLGPPRRATERLAGLASRSSSCASGSRSRSVERALLEDDVGYVRLKQFQATRRASSTTRWPTSGKKAPNLKGLVLDLRGNPGGLLDQAARDRRQVPRERRASSRPSGTSEGPRGEARARRGHRADYPIVVLVNGSSARARARSSPARSRTTTARSSSASTTFGKGCVQLVFPDVTPDKAALKLTIAQYLTAGRHLDPGRRRHAGHRARPDDGRPAGDGHLRRSDKGLRERDLSRTSRTARARRQKPLELVRYNLSQSRSPGDARARRRSRRHTSRPTSRSSSRASWSPTCRRQAPRAGARRQGLHRAGRAARSGARSATELQKLGVDWTDAAGDRRRRPLPKDSRSRSRPIAPTTRSPPASR